MRDLAGPRGADIVIEPKLGEALDRVKADVMVDLGNHAAAAQHAVSALKRGVVPIIGVQLTSDEVRDLKSACAEFQLPALVASTFSLGSVLARHLARQSAAWLPQVEIIEYQPDERVPSPSPLARQVAETLAPGQDLARRAGRGGFDRDKTPSWQDIPVHTVRSSPGAQMRIVMGGVGETLTLDHQTCGSGAWVEGLKVAITEIRWHKGVCLGLESLLFSDA